MVKYRNILVVINPEEERQIALERAVKAQPQGGTATVSPTPSPSASS